jgi:hypothetical protein
MNVSETDKQNSGNQELIKRTEMANSPFEIITTEEGSFGVMGKWRITETSTEEIIKTELEQITWNRIVQVIALINEAQKELEKQTTNN